MKKYVHIVALKSSLGLILGLILTIPGFSQEMSFGDENIKVEIKKKTSKIFGSKDKTYFLLTKKSVAAKSSCGSEIVAYSLKTKINRIVSKSCTKIGRRATEFYFENDKPIFIYRVFEFFNEKAKPSQWRNFKRISSWESRFYFNNGILGFHQHKGRKNISSKETGKKPYSQALSILNFVKTNIKK